MIQSNDVSERAIRKYHRTTFRFANLANIFGAMNCHLRKKVFVDTVMNLVLIRSNVTNLAQYERSTDDAAGIPGQH